MLKEKLGSWYPYLKGEFGKGYMSELRGSLAEKRRAGYVFPESEKLFNCFRECPVDKLKVVVLGLYPHESYTNEDGKVEGLADGMAFSCNRYDHITDYRRLPFATREFIGAIENQFMCFPPMDPDLGHVAKQGVLFYDVVQTTDAGALGSHKGMGWEAFSQEVIRVCHRLNPEVRFLIFGKYANKVFKGSGVPTENSTLLTHPFALMVDKHAVFELGVLKGLEGVDWTGNQLEKK